MLFLSLNQASPANLRLIPFDSFKTIAHYLEDHIYTILNYFPDRSTNASAESFNAKLKGFRALLRGVTDKKFFLFRVAKLYA